MPLEEYRRKLSADSTSEPFGESPRLGSRGGGMFVIRIIESALPKVESMLHEK